MHNKNWSRRGFTKAIISAQALIASGALALPLGCVETKNNEADGSLDLNRQDVLKYAMDTVIPANDKMPSASQVGGLSYIINILKELPELAPLFVSLSDKIELHSRQQWRSNFSDLAEDQRHEVIARIERNEPELFKILKDFTYESYYTNKKVFALIGYNPYPTGSSGPEMEPFDAKLLDRVKSTPPMYTKI